MDADWFRKIMKEKGVTSTDVAAIAGRARTGISHILNGKQAMTMPWIRAFAQALDLPIDEIMARAGHLAEGEVVTLLRGFAEGDAAMFKAQSPSDQTEMQRVADVFGGNRPGVDVWQVSSPALSLMGYMTGDHMLVDTHASERVRAGDVVVAQVYDRAGEATTVLRRFEPPVLIAASPLPTDQRVHVVDGNNVVIRGRVVASWRTTRG